MNVYHYFQAYAWIVLNIKLEFRLLLPIATHLLAAFGGYT